MQKERQLLGVYVPGYQGYVSAKKGSFGVLQFGLIHTSLTLLQLSTPLGVMVTKEWWLLFKVFLHGSSTVNIIFFATRNGLNTGSSPPVCLCSSSSQLEQYHCPFPESSCTARETPYTMFIAIGQFRYIKNSSLAPWIRGIKQKN